MKTNVLLTLFTFILFEFHCFSQKNDFFAPSIWINNPQAVKEGTAPFDVLNFHNKVNSPGSAMWTSAKKINGSNHFFLVYKSKKDEYLISFLGEKRSIFLDGKNQKVNDTLDLKGYNEAYGELMDIRFSSIENGRFWMNADLKTSNVYEMILVEAQKYQAKTDDIRTYLGIKYGIDLIDYKQYQYKENKLWDGNSKSYNQNIFGLAYFSYFNLLQNKSIHVKDQDLIVAMASSNQLSKKDGSYVLFGNNNKKFVFDTKTKINKKEWLAQTNLETAYVNLSFPLALFDQEKLSEYELLVQGNRDKKNYTGSIEDSLLVFRNVVFTNGVQNLIQLKEQPTDVKLDYTLDCGVTTLDLDINKRGGSFKINVSDDKGAVLFESVDYKKTYIIENKETAYLDVRLLYQGKNIYKRIQTNSGKLHQNQLKPYYLLEDTPVQIVLSENQEESNGIKYQWFKEGNLIGTGNKIALNEEGSYELETQSGDKCALKQAFSVIKNQSREEWVVYPNPAERTDEIQVVFELSAPANVEIAIYQVDGKFIRRIPIGTTQKQTFSLGTFPGGGTYIIAAYIDKKLQIKKIVIK